MRTSAAERAKIKTFEGFANPVSDDGFGNPTGGWGHTRGVRLGQPVTVAQAEKWLTEDLGEAEAAVNELVRVPLTQGQFDVLVSFTMNLGRSALAKSTLLKKLNAGDYASVRTELLRWDHADPDGSGPLPRRKVLGLTRRRTAESDHWTASSHPLNPVDPQGSRTVNGGAVATAGGAVVVAEQAQEVLNQAQWHLTMGNIVGLAVGLAILAAGLWVLYARLDDAGLIPWKRKPLNGNDTPDDSHVPDNQPSAGVD